MFGSRLYSRGGVLKNEVQMLDGTQDSIMINGFRTNVNVNSSLCLAEDAFRNLSLPDPGKFL